MPNLNEYQLIERAQAGDQTAFRTLITAYERLVYSIAFRFTRNRLEAEDLSQECFIKLWRNLDRYNPEYKLKTWLGKMITNLSLDYLKSNRKKMSENTEDIETQFDLKDRNKTEDQLHADELHTIILKLSEDLTPKQKAAFILRDLENLDVLEVCEIMNETADNLKSNLYHARKHLREQLLKYYKTSLI